MSWSSSKKKIFLVTSMVLVIFFVLLLYVRIQTVRARQFRVTSLNIGQGDSALIQFGNGQKMLVDCGPNKIVLSRLGSVLPVYDRTIDWVLATHPDLDHYGGCIDVVKRYRVKEIIVNGKGKPNDPYWREWDKAIRESGAKVKIINGHEDWRIASTTLTFFSPDDNLNLPVAATDSNNFSIVFRLTHDTSSILFTGDMELPLEHALIKKYCLSPSSTPATNARAGACPALAANILKVGHHGSDSSTSDELVAAVQPKVSIVSVGKNNYGHPSRRVLNRLERAGSAVLRTDILGNIETP